MPNWHPIVVHFPVALLSVSVLVDVAALAARRGDWHKFAYALLVAGTVGAAAAVITGTEAAPPHRQSADVVETVDRHEDLGSVVFIVFLAVSLGRLPVHLQRQVGWPLAMWLGVAGMGCVLLWMTSLVGGELVYEYGVGVQMDQID